MLKYDYATAVKIVEILIPIGLVKATLGLHEDWFDTSVVIYDTKRGRRFSNTHPSDYDGVYLNEIQESSWATPVIEVVFDDDTFYTYNCYLGTKKSSLEESYERGLTLHKEEDEAYFVHKERLELNIIDFKG